MLWRLSNRSPTNWWVRSWRVRSRWRFSGGSRSPDASRPASSMSTLSGLSSRAAKTPAGPEPTTMTSNKPVPPEEEATLEVLEPGAEHGAAEREPGAQRPVVLIHEAPVTGRPDLGEVQQQPELPGQCRPLAPEHQLERLDVELPGHDRRDVDLIRLLPAVIAVGPHVRLFELGRDLLPEERRVKAAGGPPPPPRGAPREGGGPPPAARDRAGPRTREEASWWMCLGRNRVVRKVNGRPEGLPSTHPSKPRTSGRSRRSEERHSTCVHRWRRSESTPGCRRRRLWPPETARLRAPRSCSLRQCRCCRGPHR